MSFARWLLVHSFSIFLVTLLLLGYLYREELQLEQAYHQLLGEPEPQQEQRAAAPVKPPTPPAKQAVQSPQPSPLLQPASDPPVPKFPDDPPPVADEESLEFLQSTPTVTRTIIELDDLLFKARKAYWDKDYQKAIFYYQQLIQDDGDNPDYIGELGNIYYSINDYENAAQQYYQAAIILIAKNKPEQARMLISPVTAMNRDLGDQLRQKLNP